MKKLLSLATATAMTLPLSAYAKLSERSSGAVEEGVIIFGDVMTAFAMLGGIIFVVAIWSYIKKKKSNQEPTWEVWGMVGGACLAVALTLFTDTTETITQTEQSFERSGTGFQ